MQYVPSIIYLKGMVKMPFGHFYVVIVNGLNQIFVHFVVVTYFFYALTFI